MYGIFLFRNQDMGLNLDSVTYFLDVFQIFTREIIRNSSKKLK